MATKKLVAKKHPHPYCFSSFFLQQQKNVLLRLLFFFFLHTRKKRGGGGRPVSVEGRGAPFFFLSRGVWRLAVLR